MEAEKVNVAMLGPFPPATGGIATNIQSLLRSALSRKYRFLNVRTMSSKYGTSVYHEENIVSKIFRVIGDISYFIVVLVKECPPLIHINTSFSKWAFWRDSLYLLISNVFKRKVFLQIHGGELNEFWSHRPLLTRSLIKQILQVPDLIAVLSLTQRIPFIEAGLGRKVKIFPNTVELARYDRSESFREEFNISQDLIVILFVVAHFYKEKGGMDLLKAVRIITQKHKKILAVFVGGGGEKDAMLSFCRKEGIEDYVKFTGYLQSDVVTRLQLSSDIYAFPTYYSEGLPLVILESMAAGLPIVTTPVRGIPEVVKDGDNGFIIKPLDHEALGQKLSLLIENEELRKEMGRRNIEKIRDKYDLNAVAKIFDASYQKLLSGKRTHEANHSEL